MQNTEIITSNVNLKFDIVLRRRNHFLSAIKKIPFQTLLKQKRKRHKMLISLQMAPPPNGPWKFYQSQHLSRSDSQRSSLVEKFTALLSATVAGQLVAGILNRELVVVGELLPTVDTTKGKDDYVLLAVHSDDPRIAVGLTRVVNEASSIAMDCGIYNLIVIDAKHVTANPLSIIISLSFVRENRANDVSGVLNNHLPSFNSFLAKQTSAMNRRPVDSHSFLTSGFKSFEPLSQW